MCDELKLVQCKLGIWRLSEWTIEESCTQLTNVMGVYIIKNMVNNKFLIGEGNITARIRKHLFETSCNTKFNKDVKKYGTSAFRLIGIVICDSEHERKRIELALQSEFSGSVYNRKKSNYPTRRELLDCKHFDKLLKKLNNYNIVQCDYGECWIRTTRNTDKRCAEVCFNGKKYSHRCLMYIINKGDINGVTQSLYAKCGNGNCVNWNHMELTHHGDIARKHHKTETTSDNVQRLFNQGYSKGEIVSILKLSKSTVNKYTKIKNNNRLSFKHNSYIVRYNLSGVHMDLGHYENERDALENRDYFIVKNGLMANMHAKLSFHDVDYHNFIPHKTRDGKINKHLL